MRDIAHFLFDEAELLDAGAYDSWIDLFSLDAHYWVPLGPEQADPINEVSLYYENLALMQARIGRLRHPGAMGLPTRTSHLIGNIADLGPGPEGSRIVRSRFQMVEFIDDSQRLYAGRVTHHLVPDGDTWRIRLKRVDLVNAGGIFDLLQGFL
jgi:benzoate/toluate 1,2-dioxygenase beta subunit